MDMGGQGTTVLALVCGGAGFAVATVIDHMLGVSCPDVEQIGVSGHKLFFHKCMYVAVGAGAMFLALHP